MLRNVTFEPSVWSKKFVKCDPMTGRRRFNKIHHSDWTRFIINFLLKMAVIKINIINAMVNMVEMATFDRSATIIITGDRIRKMDGRLQDIKPMVMDMDSSTMDNSTSNVVDTDTIPIGINRIIIDRDIITVEMEDIINDEKDHQIDRLWSS